MPDFSAVINGALRAQLTSPEYVAYVSNPQNNVKLFSGNDHKGKLEEKSYVNTNFTDEDNLYIAVQQFLMADIATVQCTWGANFKEKLEFMKTQKFHCPDTQSADPILLHNAMFQNCGVAFNSLRGNVFEANRSDDPPPTKRWFDLSTSSKQQKETSDALSFVYMHGNDSDERTTKENALRVVHSCTILVDQKVNHDAKMSKSTKMHCIPLNGLARQTRASIKGVKTFNLSDQELYDASKSRDPKIADDAKNWVGFISVSPLLHYMMFKHGANYMPSDSKIKYIFYTFAGSGKNNGHQSLGYLDVTTKIEYRIDMSKYLDYIYNDNITKIKKEFFEQFPMMPAILPNYSLCEPHKLHSDFAIHNVACELKFPKVPKREMFDSDKAKEIVEQMQWEPYPSDYKVPPGEKYQEYSNCFEGSCWFWSVMVLHLMMRFNLWDPKRFADVLFAWAETDPPQFYEMMVNYSAYIQGCLYANITKYDDLSRIIWPNRSPSSSSHPLVCGVYDELDNVLCQELVGTEGCVCLKHSYILPKSYRTSYKASFKLYPHIDAVSHGTSSSAPRRRRLGLGLGLSGLGEVIDESIASPPKRKAYLADFHTIKDERRLKQCKRQEDGWDSDVAAHNMFRKASSRQSFIGKLPGYERLANAYFPIMK